MIIARINFLNNSLIADLSRPPVEVYDRLQRAGILTAPNLIMLDNARTLKIELFSEDNTDEKILGLVNKKSDTLGRLNRLCHLVDGMDYRDELKFIDSLENGKYNSLEDAVKDVEKLREQRRIKNKKKEQSR